MKQILLGLCLVMLAMNGSSDQQPQSHQTEADKAKAAIRELAVALKTELGLLLSRVSLKNRNPANLPNEWQIAVLEGFEQQKAAGKDISSLVWSETVEIDGKQEFRFMKAIPTGPVCLNCHGTNLSPDVSRILADLYPMDRATGYREGDIRGAFVATSEP